MTFTDNGQYIAMFGRTVLYSNAKTINGDNVVKVLNKVLGDFKQNTIEIEYLNAYKRGYQPVLERIKEVRPEINNKIVMNVAYEIVTFKTGYLYGEPIQYVRRARRKTSDVDTVDETITDNIVRLNEYMKSESKASLDAELGEWQFTCGTAYRTVLPKKVMLDTESPFEIEIPDPRTTSIVYNSGFGKKPLMSVQEYRDEDDALYYVIYTDSMYYEVKNGLIVREEPHALGMIPITEYPANRSRLGAFEVILGILDALNNATSDRQNGIEQFIQSFMKFVNVKIDEDQFEKMRSLGALAYQSDPTNPAQVDIISSELNQSQVQIFIDHLYQMAMIICAMPDRNGTNRTTGDTGQAVIMRDGWANAESSAKDTEKLFEISETRMLRNVLNIMRNSNEKEDIELTDIEIKFTRNKTDALISKVQAMTGLLAAGIEPEIAISIVGIFGDPQQVAMDSKEYLRKWEVAATEKANELANNGTINTDVTVE